LYAYDPRGNPVLSGRVDDAADPPTRVSWLPILNPHSESRAIWEESTLFTTEPSADGTMRPLPVTRKRKKRVYPDVDAADVADSDYNYLKHAIEPAFLARGRSVRIDYVRDDAFAKPILLPDKELQLHKDTRNAVNVP